MAYRMDCGGGAGGCGATIAESGRFFSYRCGGEMIGRCGGCHEFEAAQALAAQAAAEEAQQRQEYRERIAAQLAGYRAAQSQEERAITARYEELMYS